MLQHFKRLGLIVYIAINLFPYEKSYPSCPSSACDCDITSLPPISHITIFHWLLYLSPITIPLANCDIPPSLRLRYRSSPTISHIAKLSCLPHKVPPSDHQLWYPSSSTIVIIHFPMDCDIVIRHRTIIRSCSLKTSPTCDCNVREPSPDAIFYVTHSINHHI